MLGPLEIDYPAHASSEAREAVGYARPHELELCRDDDGEGLPATVRDVRVAGALVKIEVADADDSLIQVDLGREQFERLQLTSGEKVYLRPTRMRVFTTD